MKGKIYLIGAGPGDPDLLTVKALRLLKTADAVLHDDLVTAEILRLIPAHALVQNVGKRCGAKRISQQEINARLIAMAGAGLQVVRLKSGDPSIFGRVGEEIDAFRSAGINYQLVPGVTSALGAAAGAEIPLTHRQSSSAVVFLTGHRANHREDFNWAPLAATGATLVIYMPGHAYSQVADRLMDAGFGRQTPCALVSQASTPRQRVQTTSIAQLSRAKRLPPPALLIVGEVVRFAASSAHQSTGRSPSVVSPPMEGIFAPGGTSMHNEEQLA
jgi:uroporphyrin-III C-methyltransferase